MAYIANFDQSNRANWIFDVTATDADTGDAIVFTGATVAFALRDENNCLKFSASIGDGITLVDANTLEYSFTEAQMQNLCAGTYKVGSTYTLNGETVQIFVGTVSVYDGVVA